MTKNEALEMALGYLETMKTGAENFRESSLHVVCSACEEALKQSKWQSLTDEEIEKIDEIVDTELLFCNFSGTDYIHGFARAIEQALKEKNTVS